MLNLKLNLKNTGIDQKAIMKYKEKVEQIHHELHKRANAQNDFVGWLELPTNYDKEEFKRIKSAAARIQEDSEVLVVIGIGGSYLGARAVIESPIHLIIYYQNQKENIHKYFMLEIT